MLTIYLIYINKTAQIIKKMLVNIFKILFYLFLKQVILIIINKKIIISIIETILNKKTIMNPKKFDRLFEYIYFIIIKM